MPLPEDPSIPAAEGRGRMSKRHCSSPDFTGQGERREGLLVKTQERTPGRGVLLAWLAVYLLHEVCKALLWLHKSWGWHGGGGGVQQSRTNQWLPKQGCTNCWACSALPQAERELGNEMHPTLHCAAMVLNLPNSVTLKFTSSCCGDFQP